MKYYNQSIKEILQQFNTSIEGLSTSESQKRLKEFGLNELEEKKKVPAWMLFLNQFKDFMIIILIAAAVISGLMGDATDMIIILVIVLLNAIVGKKTDQQIYCSSGLVKIKPCGFWWIISFAQFQSKIIHQKTWQSRSSYFSGLSVFIYGILYFGTRIH